MDAIVGKVVVGKVIEELTKPAVDEVKKAVGFGELLKRVKSILNLMRPIVDSIKQSSSGELDRRKEENKKLIQLFEEGETLIRKHSMSHYLVSNWIYGGKITAFYDSLRLFYKYHIPLKQSKDIMEILALLELQSKSGNGGSSGSGSGSDRIGFLGSEGKGQSGGCSAPDPPKFMVGLDMMIKLKKLVVEGDATVVVVTAPGGCGKTAIVRKLCQEPDVKGKFKDNIFYITVSKVPNIKLMAQKLFEHNHRPVPEFETDEDAINELKQLLENQAQKAPVLLVLDDVWGGPDSVESEFPLHKFLEFKIPNCRILVTSRYGFPKIGSTYKLDLLDAKQAKELLLHSALLTDEDKDLDDDVVDKIVEKCSRFPLALKVVGGLLRGLPVDIWKSQLLEWSEGHSILDSEEDLLDCLQRSLASMKAKLKDCFMDLGSFPDDKKIPIIALIDMWAELYELDDNGVHAISNLHKLSLQNLLNLVVTRRDPMDQDESWYDDNAFVLQHDILRDLAICQSSQEPMKERKRLFLDLTGNKRPDRWLQENQPFIIKARLLSISTDEMFCSSSWCNIEAPEVEVLIINFQTKEKHYKLPEFMKQMVKLKVLVVTNYGFSIPELANFSVLGSLPSLKRIMLERVSIPTFPTFCNAMVVLKNLEKMTLVMCRINKAFFDSAIKIPEMLPNLREINLDSCNDLLGFPEWLCDLGQLRKLSISYCHKPSALPEGIGRLKNLQLLRLHACTKLVELPETIVSLQELSFLDVSGCSRLKKLPEQMGNLCNLRKLYIRRCLRLTELPPSSMDPNKQLKIICDPEMARHWEDQYDVTYSRNETTLTWL